jgi:3-methyladenine DNA glycosylase AlkD
VTAWAATAAAELDAAVRAAGTPERAVGGKAYLKSDLEFYGVRLPDIRAAVRALRRARPDLRHGELLELVTLLWAEPVFERRAAAALLLTERSDLLVDGERRLGADLAFGEDLLRRCGTWALVDPLAGDAFGPALDRVGAAATPYLDRWAADEDFWIRRSALLVHLRPLRAGGGDWDRFTRYADAMLAEKEFFIRKAIGWVLRDTSKRRPDLVFEWFRPRAARASGVTRREVVKWLPPDQVAMIQAAVR